MKIKSFLMSTLLAIILSLYMTTPAFATCYISDGGVEYDGPPAHADELCVRSGQIGCITCETVEYYNMYYWSGGYLGFVMWYFYVLPM
jgi:hypothetical protein